MYICLLMQVLIFPDFVAIVQIVSRFFLQIVAIIGEYSVLYTGTDENINNPYYLATPYPWPFSNLGCSRVRKDYGKSDLLVYPLEGVTLSGHYEIYIIYRN